MITKENNVLCALAYGLESYMIEPAEEGFIDRAKELVEKLVNRIKALIIKIAAWIKEKREKLLEKITQNEKSDADLLHDLQSAVKILSKVNKGATAATTKLMKCIGDPDNQELSNDYQSTMADFKEWCDKIGEIMPIVRDKIASGKKISRRDAKAFVDAIATEVNEIKRLHSVMNSIETSANLMMSFSKMTNLTTLNNVNTLNTAIMAQIDKACRWNVLA